MAFLFILALLTSSLGLVQETILMFMLVSFGLLIFNKKLLIALYIILLPTDGIFLQEHNVAGVLNINVVVNFFTTISLLPELLKKYKLSSFQKIPNYVLVVIFLYLIYFNFKNVYFDLMTMNKAVNRLIYYIVEYLPLILIIRLIRKEEMAETVKSSIYFSAIFLTISALLSSYLGLLGFKIGAEEGLEISTLNRYGGLFGKGDENSFGIFSAMIVGFVLSIVEKRKVNFYEVFVLIFAFLGVLLSGSRAAIISLVIVALYYMLRNLSSSRTYLIFFVIGVLSLFLAPQIENVLLRFDSFSSQLETDTSSNRIGKWIMYLNHMIENPSIFLYGNERIFSLTSYEEVRAAHNFYVQMIFNAGLIPFTLFILGYARFFFFSMKRRFLLKPIYYVVPFLMETMSVSAFATLAFLSLIIAGNSSEYYKSSKIY